MTRPRSLNTGSNSDFQCPTLASSTPITGRLENRNEEPLHGYNLDGGPDIGWAATIATGAKRPVVDSMVGRIALLLVLQMLWT